MKDENRGRRSLYTILVQKLPFPWVCVYKHEHQTNVWNDLMSGTVIVMHILKGYRHINNVLSEWENLWFSVPHSLCTEQNHHFRKTLQAVSQHSVFTQEYYCNKNITETFLPIGWEGLYEILWTVTWPWEERRDLFLMTRYFCSTALIQEKNIHNPTIISMQICKGINRCFSFQRLETKPKFTRRHLWVQSFCLWVQPVLAVCFGTSSCG